MTHSELILLKLKVIDLLSEWALQNISFSDASLGILQCFMEAEAKFPKSEVVDQGN